MHNISRKVDFMASIIGTVVNGELMLIGLKVRGRHREFYGGTNTDIVEARCSLQELAERRLSTAQVDFSSGRPVLKGNFKLNSIPMEIYLGGTFSPISNEIEAVGRVTNGKEDVGYRVKVGANEVTLPTDKIDKVTQLMKPKNFVIRHDDSGKPYVAAKRGAIAELPIVLDLSKKVAKGSDKRHVQQVAKDYTFMDILNMVASMNGLIAYLPGVKYTPSTGEKKLHVNFDYIEAGQLATPYVQYAVSNANINLNFRGLGGVKITTDSGEKTLYPSIYREKSVYKNGELALDIIGIFVEKKHEAVILSSLNNVEVVTDEKIMNFLSRIVGKTPGQMSLIAVSLKGVKPYKNDTKIDYINLAIAVNAFEQVNETYKQIAKIERNYLKEANGKYGDVHEALRGLTDEELAAAALAGIDLKNYTYNRKLDDEAAKADDGADKKAPAKEKALKIGWTANLTEAAEAKKEVDINQIVDEVKNMADNKNGDGLQGIVRTTKNTLENLKKQIWDTNRACLADGSSKFILAKDGNGLGATDVTTARMKTSKRARVDIPGNPIVEGLTVDLANAVGTTLDIR